jgi:L-threonylcarbamoyladenylate synthase
MATKEKIKKAAKILKSGGVVAFPTETVFGIGAALNQPYAIKRIFKIKKRPGNKPLQVLVANMAQAIKLGRFNRKALELAEKCWPGPFTLVMPKTRAVSKLITGASSKVGLRMPDHKTALELIKKSGPIVATSANRAGEKPALTAAQVKKALPEIVFVLSGRTKSGKPSKVIDVTKGFKILRK